MRIPRRMSRQMGITSFTRKESQGHTAPYHMNTEMLRSMSIVGCRESSWVSSRNLREVSWRRIEGVGVPTNHPK